MTAPSTVSEVSACSTATGAVARRFLSHCRVAKGLSVHTLRAYGADLADFGRQVGADLAVGDVDRDTVRLYARGMLETRHLAEATVKRRMATLKVLFRWLEREEVVSSSVFHRLDVSIRLPRRLPRALNAEDTGRLLRKSQALMRASGSEQRYEALVMHSMLVVLLATGLRIGEMLAVRRDDISMDDCAIQVRGKGDRERRVYIAGKEALVVLTRFLEARGAMSSTPRGDELFLTAKGTPMTAQIFRNRLRALAKEAGVTRHVTPHMLRHTAATQLLEAGVDIRFVQRLLGHASISTTQIYTHVTDNTLKDKLNQANPIGRFLRGGTR